MRNAGPQRMHSGDEGGAATTTLVHGCLIVAFPADLAGAMERVQHIALEGVQRSSPHAVVLEMSAVRFLDCTEFDGIRVLSGMLRLLGARCLVVGLRPGVVGWLVANEAVLDGMEFGQDLESALEQLGMVAQGAESGT